MPVSVNPTWSDILAATAQAGDYEVDCQGQDILADDNRLTGLKAGTSLRIFNGKIIWPGHSLGGYHPLIDIRADNVALSAKMVIDVGHGVRAVDVSDLDLSVTVVGNQRENLASIKAGQGPLAKTGYGASLEGIRDSKVDVNARETMGGCYIIPSSRPPIGVDARIHAIDVVKGNAVISGARINAALRSRSLEEYADAKNYGHPLNGDGLTIGWGDDLTIDAEVMNNSCYAIAIGALTGQTTNKSRNIHFTRAIVRGGVTAGFQAADVDGLRIDDLDISGSAASLNLRRCETTIGTARIVYSVPPVIDGGSLSIGDCTAPLPFTEANSPEIWLP